MTTWSQLAYARGSSADNMVDPEAVVSGGTRIHAGTLGGDSGLYDGAMWGSQPFTQSFMVLFELIDVPLSFVADKILLPVTLIERAAM